MRKLLSVLLLCALGSYMIVGCKVKTTCPAYHSHFLLFPETQDQEFSLFAQDSLPKEVITSEKLWTGISVGPDNKRTYKKRHYVIPMKDVYKTEGDSAVFGGTSATNLDSTKNRRIFKN